jgi:hypothetical protein
VPPAYMHPLSGSKVKPPNWVMVNQAIMAAAVAQAAPMFAQFEGLALTSFLSLGPDHFCEVPTQCTGTGAMPSLAPSINTGQVGAAMQTWDATTPLTLGTDPGPTTDFAYFWMDPDAPAGYEAQHGTFPGGPLIAQLTLPSDMAFFVRLGLQGRSVGHQHGVDDWQEPDTVWVRTHPHILHSSSKAAAKQRC